MISPPAEKIQGPQILIEVVVVDSERLGFSRPDFILAAFSLEDNCRWECVIDRAMPPIAAYSFVLADDWVVMAGGLCGRCRANPHLWQLLIDLYSKIFPSVNWKLPMIGMPWGMQ